MEFVSINPQNRPQISALIAERWLSTEMILRGQVIDLTPAEGIAVYEQEKLIGLLTYTIRDDLCEILSLDSLLEGRGIASALITQLIAITKQNNCKKNIVITTNDNLHAIGFYQKRGFDMIRLYHNALDTSRKLKPQIPLIGENNIPLRHEIEFEYRLTKSL